eukprot:3514007-Pyramimonas_sp.AAC.1
MVGKSAGDVTGGSQRPSIAPLFEKLWRGPAQPEEIEAKFQTPHVLPIGEAGISEPNLLPESLHLEPAQLRRDAVA